MLFLYNENDQKMTNFWFKNVKFGFFVERWKKLDNFGKKQP